MKRFSLVLTLAALATTTAQAVTWQKTFGSGEGYCVQEVEDGYIVTGYNSIGQVALWLFKTDTLGNTIWSKTYGGAGSVTAGGYSIQKTQDNGYIITGVRWEGFSQIWLLKTNEKGDTVWTRNFGRSVGHCVQQTQDGGYILTGRRDWFPCSLFLLKTDSLGDSSWMRTYLLDDWVYSLGYFVQQTDDKGYIVAGLIGDTTFENGRSALWLIKLDSLGDTLWTYIQGGDNWGDVDNGRCVRQTADNQYIALANFGLLRFEQEGDTLWTRPYRNGSCVQETEDEGYALTGEGRALLSFSSSVANPGNMWLLKTNDQGDSLWERTYTEGQSFYLVQTRDKGFIVTGHKEDGLFLLKTDSLGLLGVTEEPVIEADKGWKVGSPIGTRITIFYADLPQGFHAKVFNVTGQQVDEIHATGNKGFITWGISQPPGVYFIQAPNKLNQTSTAKVVIIH